MCGYGCPYEDWEGECRAGKYPNPEIAFCLQEDEIDEGELEEESEAT